METALIWGDIATWVTGIATIALFIIGFLQIRNERMSRIKGEKELETRNRRDQAEYISCWLVKETFDNDNAWQWIAIMNQSTQPVYNVVVNAIPLAQSGEKLLGVKSHQVCVNIVPPGQGYTSVDSISLGHPGHGRIGAEIAFQDRSGNNWIRKANGELLEIKQSPMAYFDIDLPTSWISLAAELPSD